MALSAAAGLPASSAARMLVNPAITCLRTFGACNVAWRNTPRLKRTTTVYAGTLTLANPGDGTVKLHYAPAATGVAAVSTAWQSPGTQAYFGGGQRFSSVNMRGTALPLWISHGPGSNRQTSTNEIAASFFWSPSGSGAAIDSDARIVFAIVP